MSGNPILNVFPTPELPLPSKRAKKIRATRQEESSENPASSGGSEKFTSKYIFGWVIIASLIFVAVGAWANALRIIAGRVIRTGMDSLDGKKPQDDKKAPKDDDSSTNGAELSSELLIAIIFTVGVAIAIYVIKPQR